MAIDTFKGVAEWHTPALLRVTGIHDPELFKPLHIQTAIIWGPNLNPPEEILTRMVFPTALVKFGPFRIEKEIHSFKEPPTQFSTLFQVQIFARSPALYGQNVDGEIVFKGFQPGLSEIARKSVNIQENSGPNGPIEQEFFVVATLPGVFSALQIRASIGGPTILGTSSKFPSGCGDLPIDAAQPHSIDFPCLAAAINPLAILVPKIVPLSILYEPPGNCSWTNLTHEHTAGARLIVEDASLKTVNTISDTALLGVTTDHGDFTEEKLNQEERESQVNISNTQSIGTALGLPIESPGDPRCNQPGVVVPPRDSGPGRGDLFLLLVNPALYYWNTANVSNFLFSHDNPPGFTRTLLTATAAQIEGGELEKQFGIQLSDDEINAILLLDPFYTKPGDPPTFPTTPVLDDESEGAGPFPPQEIPKRFIDLEQAFLLPAGNAIEQSQAQQFVTAGFIRSKMSTSSTTTETQGLDFAEKIAVRTFAFGGSAAASAAAKTAVGWIATQWATAAQQTSSKDIAGVVGKISVPELFKDKTEITTTITYTESKSIARISEDSITQRYFIKDSEKSLSFRLFYDVLFGTFAFVPSPATMGGLASHVAPAAAMLPSFVFTIRVAGEADIDVGLTETSRIRLEKVGCCKAIPISPADYYVTNGFVQGGEAGLRLTGDARICGRCDLSKGARVQHALTLLDAEGHTVALLWINVIREPTHAETAFGQAQHPNARLLSRSVTQLKERLERIESDVREIRELLDDDF